MSKRFNKVKLRDIGEILTGNTPSKSHTEFFDTNGILFIKPDLINNERIILINDSNEYLSEEGAKNARVVPKGSVFVTCIGSIGKIGILNKDKGAFNQQINAIIPDYEICSSKFLAYSIFHRKHILISIANAPVVPIINKTQFSDFEIFLAPLNIQDKIVAALDKAQELIDKRKKQILALDEFIKSVFLDMFGDPIKNQKRWVVKKLSEVCTKITDGTHQSPKFVSQGIPFLFVSNIINNNIDFNTHKFITIEEYNSLIKRTPIDIGDILYTIVGSYGNAAVVKDMRKFCFQRHIAYLKPKKELINPIFLGATLNSEYFRAQVDRKVKGVAQKTLNLSELKEIELLLPPIDMQNKFTEIVLKTDQQKELLQKSLLELENNFNSLMQRAFNGELFN